MQQNSERTLDNQDDLTKSRGYLLDFFNYGLFVIFAVVILLATIFDPEFNHDVFYYSAIVNEQNGLDGSYEGTRSFLEARMPQQKLSEFNSEERYPRSEADFHSVLPFFEVKVGYLAIVRAISLITDPVTGMLFVNLVSVLAGSLFVFLAFRRVNGAFCFFWLPVLGALNVDMHARQFTPDALNIALYSVSGLLLMQRRYWPATALMIVATIVRPDALVFNGILAVCIFVFASRSAGAVLALGSLGAYVLATGMSGHPGWWVHFYHTLVDQYAITSDLTPPFSLSLYLKTLIVNLVRVFLGGNWALPAILAMMILYFRNASRNEQIAFHIGIFALIAIIVKIIIFPTPQIRSSIPMILVLAFCTAALMRSALSQPGGFASADNPSRDDPGDRSTDGHSAGISRE